jgi:hypothetical protein
MSPATGASSDPSEGQNRHWGHMGLGKKKIDMTTWKDRTVPRKPRRSKHNRPTTTRNKNKENTKSSPPYARNTIERAWQMPNPTTRTHPKPLPPPEPPPNAIAQMTDDLMPETVEDEFDLPSERTLPPGETTQRPPPEPPPDRYAALLPPPEPPPSRDPTTNQMRALN